MKWFRRGPVDPVAEQLNEIESRGRSTISLAHIAAFLVLMVFSLGSLVGLTGDSLNALLTQWRASHTTNLTAAIAISVSTLLVFAMDIGMYYAAMRVRVMKRRNQGDGVRLDWSVIISVGVVEALSYAYMSYLYDHPHGVIWVLIILRAISAPALAAYLSLAESSPVGERDIVQSVERVVAHGVITEMTRIAGDPRASLERKLALYKGARGGLDALISAESQTRAYSLMPAPQLPQPSQSSQSHELYGIAAEPTLHLPPAAPSTPAPHMGAAGHPTHAAFSRWDDATPDDDGPGGPSGPEGGRGPERDRRDDDYEMAPSAWFATDEIPAVSAVSLNGHSPKIIRNGNATPNDWDADGDTTGYGQPAPVSASRRRMDQLTRDLANEGKAARRERIVRQMLTDNAEVRVGTVRKRLRREGVGAAEGKVAVMIAEMADRLGIQRATDDDDEALTLPRIRAIR